MLSAFPAWSADCVTPPAGLVSWWPGGGYANDIAGNNNGTLQGGVTFATGMVGQAFNLDGSSQYVDVPGSASLNPTASISLEAWIYPRLPLDSVAAPIIKKAGQGFSFQNGYTLEFLGTSGVIFGVYVTGAGWLAQTPAPVPFSQWSHVAGVYDGTNASVFVNGVLVASTPAAWPWPAPIVPSSNNLQLGHDPSNPSRYFNGLIDEASINNTALSSAQIQAIYTAGSAGKCRLPRDATAGAVVLNGFVVGATITDDGYGYTNTPAVRIIGGGGSGAQAVAVVSYGVVVAVNVLDAGSGYTNTPVIVIEPPFIAQPAMGIKTMSLLTFTNLAVGTNYQFQVFLRSTWSNLGAAFTAAGPTFTQYVSGTADPNRYHLATTPVPLQARATPQLVNGFVVGATVYSGGSGYVTNPAVTIVGGGGTNATAVSHVSGGKVTSITITDAGIGYTSPPTIQIAPPPPGVTLSPTVLPVMRLDFANLSPYDNYQIQLKPDLGGAWGNWNGGLFSPTAVTNSQYLFITNGIGFFRLQYVP